jgi:hypothetical protein
MKSNFSIAPEVTENHTTQFSQRSLYQYNTNALMGMKIAGYITWFSSAYSQYCDIHPSQHLLKKKKNSEMSHLGQSLGLLQFIFPPPPSINESLLTFWRFISQYIDKFKFSLLPFQDHENYLKTTHSSHVP